MELLETLGLKETPKGPPEGAEENPIIFSEITKILNYETYFNSIQKKIVTISASHYANYVEANLGYLGDNITITNDTHYVKIVIENLFFLVLEEVKLSFAKNINPKFELYLVFKNNTFANDVGVDHNNTIIINLHGGGFTDFDNNKFENTELSFVIKDNRENYIYSSGETPKSKGVNFENNEVYAIEAPSYCDIYFKKNNIIEKINIYEGGKESSFGINWTPYQKINTKEPDAEVNRDSFILLKEIAVRKGDKLQEFYLNREILKCDHYLIKQWEFWSSLQDRAIMWFGKIVSDHGISLFRPAIGIIGINFIITLIFYYIDIGCGKSFGHIFWEMFDPLSNLSESIGLDENTKNGWVSFANVVQKAIYAILLYELIRVGRRFVAK